MITNLCGNCDYALITASGKRRCCRFSKQVSESDTCDEYFNYKKTQIYNQIKDVLMR